MNGHKKGWFYTSAFIIVETEFLSFLISFGLPVRLFLIYILFASFPKLLDEYDNGDDLAVKMFDNLDWYIVPSLNVDGYSYTWSSVQNHVKIYLHYPRTSIEAGEILILKGDPCKFRSHQYMLLFISVKESYLTILLCTCWPFCTLKKWR